MALIYAYADESGDTGYQFQASSSRYFVLGIVVPDQPEQIVDQLLAARRKLGRNAAFEFHYRESDSTERAAFFNAIAPVPMKLLIATIDKTHAPLDFQKLRKIGLYSHALAAIALRSPFALDNCKLFLDGSGYPKQFLREVKNAVRFACRVAGKPKQNFQDIRILDSGNALVQSADMFTGVAAEVANRGSSEWLPMLTSKAVLQWNERFD